MHPEYTPAEFAHWLLPRAGVIDTFVIEEYTLAPGGDGLRSSSNTVTDLISFYHLPSTVIGERSLRPACPRRSGWANGVRLPVCVPT